MIVSAQSLALYMEQDYEQWSLLKRNRAKKHIQVAGTEVRGALAALYSIPVITRAADTSANPAPGSILTPEKTPGTPIDDPENTALGPIVLMLAAAYLIDPTRGFQPQEDRSAAADYRISARAQLKALQNGTAFIAPLDKLDDYGITPTEKLTAMFTNQRLRSGAAISKPKEGFFGSYHDPASGTEFDL